MSTKHQKFTVRLSGYSTKEQEAIALEILEKVKKRTQSGRDKNGNAFEPYSESYKKSAAFKAAGKTSKVNLTLSEDMLNSMEILKNEKGRVTLGFEDGSVENGKADGNIRGTYGKPRKVGPARDFLGISNDELSTILKKYPPGTKRSENRAERKLASREDPEDA